MSLHIKKIKWTIKLTGKGKSKTFLPKMELGKSFKAIPSEIFDFMEKELNRMKPSRTLDVDTLSKLEPVAEQDLKNVKIHTDELSNLAAGKIGAEAFTAGKDIYFARGKFRPDTEEGIRLLKHEMTHIMQEEKGETKNASIEKMRQLEQEALANEQDLVFVQGQSIEPTQEEVKLSKDKRIQAKIKTESEETRVVSINFHTNTNKLIAVKFDNGKVINCTQEDIQKVYRMMEKKIKRDLKIAKERLTDVEYRNFYKKYISVFG
jgi:hypothetical protein